MVHESVFSRCVLHSFPGGACVVEDWGHIGHGVVVHGCTVGPNALIGMDAVVMDDAKIGEGAFVDAMAFIKAGLEVPPRTPVAGILAKVVRALAWSIPSIMAAAVGD